MIDKIKELLSLKSVKVENFNELSREEVENKTNIYFIIDSKDEIIYIGQAQDVKGRLRTHFKNFSQATKCVYASIDNNEANNLECFFILNYLPIENKNIPKCSQWITLDDYQSFDQRFYSNRVGVLRKIKEHNIENVNNFYHQKDLNFISSLLDGEI